MASSRSDLAAAIRDACARAAVDAYEDAGVQGLCAEGRFEAAIGAIERLEACALASVGVCEPAPASTPAATLADGLVVRRATRDDLAAIVALLADDAPGAQRGQPGPPLAAGHVAAFDAIAGDARCELLVACRAGRVVGTMQLDYVPGLSWQGAWQATIEALRVSPAELAAGTACAMIEWAVGRARARGCRIVRLSGDRSPPDARRCYERLGFAAEHVGVRRVLD